MQQYADKLKWIAERASQDKNFRFATLAYLINESSLAQCYKKLNKSKACGVDGVSMEEYGNNLEQNLAALIKKMKIMKYKPKPVRRVYIPKTGKKEQRPLGIPSIEDKCVQMALKELLEAIFEQDFLECSHGFRPKNGCHTAIKALDVAVMRKPINFVVEVDIKGFFDNVNHKWMYEMLRQRISDRVFLGLIWRMLRSGIMEAGVITKEYNGTPQGGIVSPILANIYLHLCRCFPSFPCCSGSSIKSDSIISNLLKYCFKSSSVKKWTGLPFFSNVFSSILIPSPYPDSSSDITVKKIKPLGFNWLLHLSITVCLSFLLNK